ncbi:hypothetical protein N781_03570 [Pontibacillus halophilus JSM 076056 = DSM 19796]|uniref:Uncharacterized protein n=1 Tax=Pontibacillus halophilus JSM 076056 = DSM 19796 TaxID=1385510 RepID=A0A0A5GKI7_9BACI|nr:hypothetical protein [Pontibacillus halophilus]KGX91675.1 hypothetical protein N781_03570 [Pontibacillus halophilus JSM 076056 = DSM 19796]
MSDTYLHILFGSVALLFLYVAITPVVKWLVHLKWSNTLTYVVVGLCHLCILVLFELYQGVTGSGYVEIRDVLNGMTPLLVLGLVLVGKQLLMRGSGSHQVGKHVNK